MSSWLRVTPFRNVLLVILIPRETTVQHWQTGYQMILNRERSMPAHPAPTLDMIVRLNP